MFNTLLKFSAGVRGDLLWELLYADDLTVMAESDEGLQGKWLKHGEAGCESLRPEIYLLLDLTFLETSGIIISIISNILAHAACLALNGTTWAQT